MKAVGREVGSAFVLVHVNTQHGVTPPSEDKKGGKKKAKKEVCDETQSRVKGESRGPWKHRIEGGSFALGSGLRKGWLAI
jgi:hypothetical protein